MPTPIAPKLAECRCLTSVANNDVFEKVTGYKIKKGDAISSINYTRFMSKNDKDSVVLLYKSSLIAKKQAFSFDIKKNSVDEIETWYRLSNKAILFEKEYYFLHTAIDISKQKRNEKKLNAEIERAEENDRLKSAFLANMSHEIRTPMNAIVGAARLLEQEPLTLQQFGYTQIMRHVGHQLQSIIDNVLDMSRIVAGSLALPANTRLRRGKPLPSSAMARVTSGQSLRHSLL